MKNRGKEQLLKEISSLLQKYGPNTFAELAEELRSEGQRSADIVAVLEAAAKAGKAANLPTSSRSTFRNLRSTLASLSKTEPEKSEILVKLLEDVMAGSVLPTLADIRNFVSASGFPPLQVSSRKKAIVPLLESLQTLSLEELQNALVQMPKSAAHDERSLKGWSDIILDEQTDSSKEL